MPISLQLHPLCEAMLFHWKPNLIHPGQLIFSFHYSSLSILGTINYYLSTHRSILTIERHNLYSVNFHLIDFIFKSQIDERFRKHPIQFLIGTSSTHWSSEGEREKKKKIVDRRRCHGYEFEFLVNRPARFEIMPRSRACVRARAAHGSGARGFSRK